MKRWAIALAVVGVGVGLASGQETPGARRGWGWGGGTARPDGRHRPRPGDLLQTRPVQPRTDTSVTTGVLRPAGRPEMSYTAVAGYMPLKDEQDRLRANIFYVNYSAGTTRSEAEPATTEAGGAEGSVSTARPSVTLISGVASRGGHICV